MFDPTAFDALHRASSMELYYLSVTIDRLLADPRRVLDISRHLHTGQTVRFLDAARSKTTPVMSTGRILERQTYYAVLSAHGKSWKVPYAAIEVPVGSSEAAATEPAAPPAPCYPTREDFRKADRVSFEDKYLNTKVGVILRVNTKTASIDCDDGTQWRVPFAMLRHLVDVSASHKP